MNREVNPNHRTANHLCDPTRLRAETRRTQGHPVPRGGFHKAGEGPAFGGSLVTFCPVRKLPQRSVPGWGAGLRLRNGRRAKLFFLPLTKPGAHAPVLVCLFRKKSLPCVKGGGGFYGAPAKAQRKRVWWGEEVRRRERDLPRLSGARRGILSPHRRVGGIDRLTAQVPACQPGGDASRWGFLLGGQKKPKPA